MRKFRDYLILELSNLFISFLIILPIWYVLNLCIITVYPDIFILEWRYYEQNLTKLIYTFYFAFSFFFLMYLYTFIFFCWLYWDLYIMFVIYIVRIILNYFYYIKILIFFVQFIEFGKRKHKYFYMYKFFRILVFFLKILYLRVVFYILRFRCFEGKFFNKIDIFLYFKANLINLNLVIRFELLFILLFNYISDLNYCFTCIYFQIGGPFNFIGF